MTSMNFFGPFIFMGFVLVMMAGADTSVPTPVLEAFAEKYPDVKEPSWEVDGNGYWEAHFVEDDVKYRADFRPNGMWIETENGITYDDLPPDVRAAIELKYRRDQVRDVEAVDSATHGLFYDVELKQGAGKFDLMLDRDGKALDPVAPPTETGFFQYWMGQATQNSPLLRTGWPLVFKTLFNFLTIFVFAYLIYYRRHHDHHMLFLLLAFNLFLFPIFLSSSLVTAGFGFTIFALLALVRLRSVTFNKAELAYLLGALSLTFVNTMMPAVVDALSATTIIVTAIIADRPSLWRDSYQKIEVEYAVDDPAKMLDQDFLRKRLADDFQIDVREITIERVLKKNIRLTLLYRDLPEIRQAKREALKEKQRSETLKRLSGLG
jgi:hypothetical protein